MPACRVLYPPLKRPRRRTSVAAALVSPPCPLPVFRPLRTRRLISEAGLSFSEKITKGPAQVADVASRGVLVTGPTTGQGSFHGSWLLHLASHCPDG